MWIPPIDSKRLPSLRKKQDSGSVVRKGETPEVEEKSESEVFDEVISENLEYEHDVIYHRPKHQPKNSD